MSSAGCRFHIKGSLRHLWIVVYPTSDTRLREETRFEFCTRFPRKFEQIPSYGGQGQRGRLGVGARASE